MHKIRRSRALLSARFVHCLTPDMLGGDGEERSLLVTSIGKKRVRQRDSREIAYEFLLTNVPAAVLRDERMSGKIYFSPPAPSGAIGGVLAWEPDGFATFEAVLHEAGFTSLKFARRDDALDFYAAEE